MYKGSLKHSQNIINSDINDLALQTLKANSKNSGEDFRKKCFLMELLRV